MPERLERASLDSHTSLLSFKLQSKSIVRTLYWLAIFSALFVFTVRGIATVLVDYFSFPVSSNSNLTHVGSVEFPAVTICNANRVNCENLFQMMRSLEGSLASGSPGMLHSLAEERSSVEAIFCLR